MLLICAAAVIVLGVLLGRLSSHVGIPVLLGFILLGMIFGSEGLVKIPFENFDFANQICSVALIFIIFYGGFGTNWRQARRVALPSVLLSTLGVVVTAVLTGLFCHLALGFEWGESFLLGAVVSSTDAASVFSILRSKRLNLRYGTASMLEMESGSNDPVAYMMTCLILSGMGGDVSVPQVAAMAFFQVFFGLFCGMTMAWLFKWLVGRLKGGEAENGPLLIVAIALLSYAVPTLLGGNGYLSTYVVGIVLGNQRMAGKKVMVQFLSGVSGLMQIALFFLLGLLSFPSQLVHNLPAALAITLFLTLVARPAAVGAILTPFRAPLRQQALVAWAGLRGATSIVFAIMTVIDQADTHNDLFHIAFCIVLLSIGVQGTLLPWFARKVDMIHDGDDVLKTFSDYSEDTPIEFIPLEIDGGHPWNGSQLQDVVLPPHTRVAMILRGGQKVIPKGDTRLLEGDVVILSALSSPGRREVSLTEMPVDADSPWCGKRLSEIKWGDSLVVLLQRDGVSIIPTGSQEIRPGDVLVVAGTG